MVNMRAKCSSSKQEQLDDSRSCGLLSDLPLGIIHIILALIPIKEAVRTSVLSTQWRYTWTTLPHLEFDDRCASQENKAEYEQFITRVLFRHKGPIHKFKMSCKSPCDFEDLDELILCLSRNGIRELNLDKPRQTLLKMHSSIYSCKKMTILRLYGCELDPPPLSFKGFLFLRFLSLGRVSLSTDEVYSLVAVCPRLENFELLEMEKNFELNISAPHLKHMLLKGGHEKICINAPLLTEISVELSYYNSKGSDQELKSAACDYALCFAGFTNLQKLFAFNYFTKYLSLGIELSHHSLVFHHLKVILLDKVNSKDAKEMRVVAHLVIGAPNLQELKIGLDYGSGKYDVADSEAQLLFFQDLECSSNFKLEKLTDVFVYVEGNTMEVEFLKFLLKSSPALETMIVVLESRTGMKWKNLRAKLKGCNWASPTVKLRDGMQEVKNFMAKLQRRIWASRTVKLRNRWQKTLSSKKHQKAFRKR